jgi:hypothetical protein
MVRRNSCLAVADAEHDDGCERCYLAEDMVMAFTMPFFSFDARGKP